jgi:hypothetical protein
MTQYSKALG